MRPFEAHRIACDADPTARDLQGLRHPRPVRRADRRRDRRADRPRLRAGARRAGGQAGRRAARRAGPRHAPDRAGAGGALQRGPAGRGRARARRRPGGHRDALLPRRLARARRRADVHRLAQPEGLHRLQARARGRDRAVRRQRHPGHPPADRGRPRRGRKPYLRGHRRRLTRRPRHRRGGRLYAEFQRGRPGLHRSRAIVAIGAR